MSTPTIQDPELVIERQSATTWLVALIHNGANLTCNVVDLRRRPAREDEVAAILKMVPTLGADDLHRRLLEKARESHEAPASDRPQEAVPAWVESFFPRVEPASDPVAGDVLLDDIAAELRRLLVLPPHGAEVIATYCALSYVLDLFDVAPRLILTSPRKRCGKSRTLNAIAGACRRGLLVENLTAPVLFRIVNTASPVLLLDECDAWFAPRNGDDAIRGIVNSGFEKPALVLRCEGENLEPTPFSCFGLVVMASIGKLPETVEDRAIVLPMRRRAKGENIDRAGRSKVRRRMAAFAPRLLRWSDDHRAELASLEVALPPSIDYRAIDLWEPLFRIATVVGGDWPERISRAAGALAGDRDAEDALDQDPGLRLLADLRDAFAQQPGAKHLETETILQRLRGLPDRPWHSWGDGKGLTTRSLAKTLRAFDVRPRDVWNKLGGSAKGYRRNDLEAVWASYLPAASAIPREPAQDQGLRLADGAQRRNPSASRQAAQDPGSRGIADSEQGERYATHPTPSRESGKHDDLPPPDDAHERELVARIAAEYHEEGA